MKVFEYGDLSRELDATDYIVLEKFEKAMGSMQARATKAGGIKPASAAIKEMVQAATQVFDDVFGEGAANEAFGGSITSYEQVLDGIAALVEFFDALNRTAISKYSPNRAARRSGK